MDFSSPVAKRTRLQEALVYRRLYEEKKRNAGVSSSGSHNDDGVEFLGEAGVFDSVQKFVAESDGKNSDRKNSSRKKNGGENSDEDVTDVVSISDDSEASDYEEEEDDDDDDYIVDPTIDRDERGNQASKLGKKKVELGTSSHPFCVDVDEGEGDGDGEGEEEWEEEEEEEGRDSSSGHAEFPKTIGRKDKGELGKHTKRKRIRALKHCDALKILVDSIWAKNSGLLEELVSPRGSDSIEETAPAFTELPLKFKFGVDESIPLGKSQPEIGMNQLWAEFDFVLRSAEIGSKETNVDGEEDFGSAEVEIDQAVLCHQGNHQLVLDEQIGMTCCFCSFVQLEIKYILPSFWSAHNWSMLGISSLCERVRSLFLYPIDLCTFYCYFYNILDNSKAESRNPWGGSEKGNAGKEDCNSIFDELQFQKPGCGSQSGSDHGLHPEGTVWDIIPGKTRLTIVFLQTYMELYPACRPVIIAPRTMLLTWEEEFKKWNVDIPFHNLNKLEYSGKENITALNFLRRISHQGQSAKSIRMVRKILLELPGLLVLDEGHTPRNEQSLIWKALSKIDTERRIILSGTPFQNNFKELYNTLCLVRPKFADRIAVEQYGGFRGKRGRKSNAARGKWDLLTSSIGKIADDKVEELRAMIEPFVHIHKGTILQENLPGLKDSVVVLQPSDLQRRLLESIREKKNPLELGYLVSLISVHPSLLPSDERKLFFDQTKLEKIKLNPDIGVKTKFLMAFIRFSETMNEKVLVFSQFLDPLTYLMDQLKYHFHWIVGKEVLYMDGQRDVKQRQSSINTFNDPASQVRVLLASTKACSEGISLVGASRVILLDVVWNPSVERQAISRAYRLGQRKVVYIYHLLTSGTMEEEKYCRQAKKDRLSELVFSSKDKTSAGNKISSTVSEDKILEEMVQHNKLKDMAVPRIGTCHQFCSSLWMFSGNNQLLCDVDDHP
ncbi:SNF2 domain-containing protein CLASSY 3 [Vitis vinifera]|uniref:SNF2 domain-containing protein CLASSY 3 n=1 Tax=Vitis vinifera TaxID=29760 RepID=A0A438DZ51_VITVI|nr:SNF2 domain-containing protein CLASSY 3 [Vitis vinifera]